MIVTKCHALIFVGCRKAATASLDKCTDRRQVDSIAISVPKMSRGEQQPGGMQQKYEVMSY